MYRERCAVLDNRKTAPGHFILKLRSERIARAAAPGQFVQILCAADSMDPLLPRPFSFLNASRSDFSILYHVVGQGTRLLAELKKGDVLPVLGPLGCGFSVREKAAARLLVGGGVGIPPLYHLAETWIRTKTVKKGAVRVFLGARNKSLLLCEKDFLKLGVGLILATDDGSKGRKGFVTQTLEEHLRQSKGADARIFTCGPTPMLKAVSALAARFSVPCEVSVEVPMACGFGACLGCAIKVKAPVPTGARHASSLPDHRFAIACTEGPVFRGADILWD